MSFRLSWAAGVISAILLQQLPLIGQTNPPPANFTKTATWTAPISTDGHVDLQGNWVNSTTTPLERPKQLEGREFLTETEVAELKQRADKLFKDGRGDF